MTETPNGPRDPAQTDLPSSPQPGPPPYAGSEWRRPEAPEAPTLRAEHGGASVGDATSDDAGRRIASGSQDLTGAEAALGSQDAPGPHAASGSQDAPGAEAARGVQDVGSQGAPGSQAASGSQDARGFQGAPGSQAASGFQDAPGAEAASGFRDAPGLQAASGSQDAPGFQVGPGSQDAAGAQAGPSTGAQTGYPTGAQTAGSAQIGYAGAQAAGGAEAAGAQGPGAQAAGGAEAAGAEGAGAQGAGGAQGGPGPGFPGGYPTGTHGGYATGAQAGSSGDAGGAPGNPSYQGGGSWNGGPYGQPQYGATRPGTPYGNGAPWPYAAPEPKKKGGGRRLLAGGVLAAVLGGLAGGGLVAAFDRNDTTTAGGITIQGSSAPAAQNQSGSVEAVAATAMKSVVTLSVRGSQEAGTGSGIVIRSDGYVLTNEHVTAVANGGGTITVAFADGRTASAKLVGADKETDLAVVKVNLTGLTAATFADSDALKVGQTVVAVGSPLGLNGTVTEGIVSALHRPTSGASDNSAVIDAIQTDAAINQGNSGGALVDLAGRVVGINQSIATAGSGGGGFGQQGGEAGNIGIGFAIPADTAARISQELITSGKATHALLGVQTQTATSADQVTAIGATIAQVTPGEAAADAGIKAGDVVTKVNDRVIGQSEHLAATIRSYAPGTKVTLTIKRGNDTSTVTVTLGSDAGH